MTNLKRKLQKTNKDQYLLTIPKHIIQLLNWEDKDTIEFGFHKDRLTIKKVSKRGKIK